MERGEQTKGKRKNKATKAGGKDGAVGVSVATGKRRVIPNDVKTALNKHPKFTNEVPSTTDMLAIKAVSVECFSLECMRFGESGGIS